METPQTVSLHWDRMAKKTILGLSEPGLSQLCQMLRKSNKETILPPCRLVLGC